jgi:hypothetical protein
MRWCRIGPGWRIGMMCRYLSFHQGSIRTACVCMQMANGKRSYAAARLVSWSERASAPILRPTADPIHGWNRNQRKTRSPRVHRNCQPRQRRTRTRLSHNLSRQGGVAGFVPYIWQSGQRLVAHPTSRALRLRLEQTGGNHHGRCRDNRGTQRRQISV